MDKLTIISGCLFLAADIFAIASIANPDWINTGEATGMLKSVQVHWCSLFMAAVVLKKVIKASYKCFFFF